MKSTSSKGPNFLYADDLDKKRGLTPITKSAIQMKAAAFDPFALEEKKDKSFKGTLSRTDTVNSVVIGNGSSVKGIDSNMNSKSNFFEKKPAQNLSLNAPDIIINNPKPLTPLVEPPKPKDIKLNEPSKRTTNDIPAINEPVKKDNDWDFFNEKPELKTVNIKPNNLSIEEEANKSKGVNRSKDHIVSTSWGDFEDDVPKAKKLAPQNLAYTFAQPNLRPKENQKVFKKYSHDYYNNVLEIFY
jgi:hypothetical protein